MKTIEVIVGTAGDIKIDALGFSGADCEKATHFLEQALGVTQATRKKPEYYARTTTRQRQGLQQ